MAIIKIDVDEYMYEYYRDHGHPLGKNMRGFKKWIKHRIIQALIEIANKA